MGGTDGANPYAVVTIDREGNLYGTTFYGGTFNAGVVYKLDAAGTESVLYTFTGGADGGNPFAGVVLDAAGNLYGTTETGNPVYGGWVYKVTPSGQETVLYSGRLGLLQAGVILDAKGNLYGSAGPYVFKISPTGRYTELAIFNLSAMGGTVTSSLIRDAEGNLYGTTAPTSTEGEGAPFGAVFEVSPGSRDPKILYEFPAFPAGSAVSGIGLLPHNPGLVTDQAGTLFGITHESGPGGTIYELSAAGVETVLHQLPPAPNGSAPLGPLTVDPSRGLLGTTVNGGPVNEGVLFELNSSGETVLPPNLGVVGGSVARDREGNLYFTGGPNSAMPLSIYKLSQDGISTVLYTFTGGTDGNGPLGVVLDSSGNLYGVSTGGGAPSGLVFRLSPSGQFTVLYSFLNGSDGSDPNYELTLDEKGNVYGSTVYGGSGAGVVFRISPSGGQTVLHTFDGTDGANPTGKVSLDSKGNLYGVTAGGGTAHLGILCKLEPSGAVIVLHQFVYDETGAAPAAGPTLDSSGTI